MRSKFGLARSTIVHLTFRLSSSCSKIFLSEELRECFKGNGTVLKRSIGVTATLQSLICIFYYQFVCSCQQFYSTTSRAWYRFFLFYINILRHTTIIGRQYVIDYSHKFSIYSIPINAPCFGLFTAIYI